MLTGNEMCIEHGEQKFEKLLIFANYVIAPSFSHPHTRPRLEKPMGSTIVRLTDRQYMQRLQDRIFEERLQRQRRRIQERRVLTVVAGRAAN